MPIKLKRDPLDDSIGFIFVGDWGFKGQTQRDVADQMGSFANMNRNDVEFVIALGDNFYKQESEGTHDGVYDDTDKQWDVLFNDVYSHPALRVPFYAVLGNHDYHGNPQAQIDYYKNKRDNRWTMPDHLYNREWYRTGTSDLLLEIIFIDTSILSPTIVQETDNGGKYEVKKDALRSYYDQLEKLMKKSRAPWLIVCGHYTVYTSADQDNDLVDGGLVNLLKKYGVAAYIDGHDHSMQYLSWDGVDYVIAGTGSKLKNHLAGDSTSDAEDGVKFTSLAAGFGAAKVTSTSLDISLIGSSGDILYKHSLNSPRSFAAKYTSIMPFFSHSSQSSTKGLFIFFLVFVFTYYLIRLWRSLFIKRERTEEGFAYETIP